jgi:hypothetical protein
MVGGCYLAEYGGGVLNLGRGNLTITHSTISGNTAGTNGGGVFNEDFITLARTLISGNTISSGGTCSRI